ncbi:MAG: D-alanyl-D-alanine carboxypeptidase family protein [Eubacterium sp.]|nr:D-alanyl-D-alanine carboxypeptidase family protein [Eubacterium sp.]
MKRAISIILAMSILFAFPYSAYAKENKEIEVKSSILMNIDTGEVIKENNAYEHLSPASVTKLMSILLILEAIDSGKIKLTDEVAATQTAVSKGGSQIWLEVGEKMSVNDLFKAVVIASANDACTLLGEYVAGSDSAFVDMMNQRVKTLGLKNSHFENCTGLDDEITNHYSCAYDLAVIAKEIMKHKLILKYSTVWLDSLRGGKTELNNTNKLINKYNGMTGLKTGTTSNAGFCLCATATRDNISFLSVVLGAKTSDDRFDLTRELLDYGFANYKLETIKIDSSKIKDVKVKGGKIKSIKPTYSQTQKVLLPKNSEKISYKYSFKKEVKAPIKKGDSLGKIEVFSSNKKISTVELKSDKNIKSVSFLYIFKKMINNI